MNANRLEKLVWEKIDGLLIDPAFAGSLIDQAKKEHAAQAPIAELDKLRNRLRGVEEQIEALAEHLFKIPKGVSRAPIYAQMQKLEVIKEGSRRDMEQMGRSGVCSDLPAGLEDYRDYLTALRSVLALSDTPELRARLIKWLVARVELLPHIFKIHYFVGKSVLVPVDWDPSADKAHVGPGAVSAPSLPIRMVRGSNTLTNGAGDEVRTRYPQLGRRYERKTRDRVTS